MDLSIVLKWAMIIGVIVVLIKLLSRSSEMPLEGTYRASGMAHSLITFGEGGEVSLDADGSTVTGFYALDDSSIIIKYKVLGKDHVLKKSFGRDGDTIYVGGIRYFRV